ncbi:MAG: sugar phosphate isomerase/epimerase [Planctomycetes bacterium]|nr:sugar phosphate isomerase/epimerase [Planctomycetota bacterium]
MKRSQLAAQLYTVRDHCRDAAGLAASCAKISAIGYRAVQVSGVGPIPPDQIKRICADHALTICATHENGATIVDEPQKVIDRLGALGCDATAYPFPHVPIATEADVRALARRLDAAGARLRAAGITLCYHNHALELHRVGARTALDWLYDDSDPKNLQGEPDTYWVQAGGGDPVAWCERLTGRLPLIHLKDFGVDQDGKPVIGEIGAGNLAWDRILPAAERSGCRWFIVEQDTCPGDPFDSLATSWRFLAPRCVA